MEFVYCSDHTCEVYDEKERVISKGGRIEQLWDEKTKTFDGLLNDNSQDLLEYLKEVFLIQGNLPVCVSDLRRIVVTRSIGDKCAAKIGVTCIPDVTILNLEEEDAYMILATDGLWDGLSVEEAANIVSNVENLDEGARNLTQTALKKLEILQIDDNVTALVVKT